MDNINKPSGKRYMEAKRESASTSSDVVIIGLGARTPVKRRRVDTRNNATTRSDVLGRLTDGSQFNRLLRKRKAEQGSIGERSVDGDCSWAMQLLNSQELEAKHQQEERIPSKEDIAELMGIEWPPLPLSIDTIIERWYNCNDVEPSMKENKITPSRGNEQQTEKNFIWIEDSSLESSEELEGATENVSRKKPTEDIGAPVPTRGEVASFMGIDLPTHEEIEEESSCATGHYSDGSEDESYHPSEGPGS